MFRDSLQITTATGLRMRATMNTHHRPTVPLLFCLCSDIREVAMITETFKQEVWCCHGYNQLLSHCSGLDVLSAAPVCSVLVDVIEYSDDSQSVYLTGFTEVYWWGHQFVTSHLRRYLHSQCAVANTVSSAAPWSLHVNKGVNLVWDQLVMSSLLQTVITATLFYCDAPEDFCVNCSFNENAVWRLTDIKLSETNQWIIWQVAPHW